mmetsp:Transcript_20587/g.27950  ORF Transcript_20587/g.27950 Transcript_20587/m.27950 type:complete len:97 (+) Transcript_20587:434-724(+)
MKSITNSMSLNTQTHSTQMTFNQVFPYPRMRGIDNMAYGTKKIHIRDRCPSGNIMLKHAAVYGAFGNPNEIRDSLNVASGVEKMQNIFNEISRRGK